MLQRTRKLPQFSRQKVSTILKLPRNKRRWQRQRLKWRLLVVQVMNLFSNYLIPPKPPNNRRVSSRTTKGQRPFRYNPTNYCLYLLFILCCFDTVVDAAPLPQWNEEIIKEQPIINRSILWHPWERAIFL